MGSEMCIRDRLDHVDGSQDRVRDVRAALVATQHRVDAAQHAEFLHAGDDVDDILSAQMRAAPFAIASVIRKMHGVDRPYFVTETLQREDGRGVSDVAVSD